MAQGATTKKPKAAPGPGLVKGRSGAKTSDTKTQLHRKAVAKPRKLRTAADRVQRKFTAGLVVKTEKVLGQRAGHLELIGKGKKKGGAADKTDAKQKGGSRKFG